ncbi:MAG: FAD-dependent monooxygenase, partial [Mycobacterium sp.]
AVNLGWKLAAEIHGWAQAGLLDTYHDERHLAGGRTLLHTRAQVALRRGHDPAAEALRELFSDLLLDEQPLRRMGALLAGDVRYPMPGPAPHPLAGAFAPDLTAGLMRDARPVLLDLADRADLRQVAHAWRRRITIHTVAADDRRTDALLIRPDAHIAWAATLAEPTETAAAGLRESLRTWFGEPASFGPGVGQDDVDEVAPDE